MTTAPQPTDGHGRATPAPHRVGVLALQGDVVEHERALRTLGAEPVRVRRAADLEGLDGLVIPGGESTTIAKLARIFGLIDPLREAIASGLPVYGSCAGMILLADELIEPATDSHGVAQETFGGLDVAVRRNAFGRQVDSFETDLDFGGLDGDPVRAVFIRAPRVERAADDVSVLASVDGYPVAVRQGSVLATAFHPESTDDLRVHRLFLDMIDGAGRA